MKVLGTINATYSYLTLLFGVMTLRILSNPFNLSFNFYILYGLVSLFYLPMFIRVCKWSGQLFGISQRRRGKYAGKRARNQKAKHRG